VAANDTGEEPGAGQQPPGEAEAVELEQLRVEHAAMTSHLRSSPEYRVGEALLGLRSREGRRAFPQRVRSLAGELRRRRRPTPRVAPPPQRRRPITVPVVLDEFSHACLGPEVHLVEATPRDHGLGGADLLFAETAWNGNSGRWAGEFSRFSPSGRLAQLVADARSRGVPTVLWNKEDPVNYPVFLAAARDFDVVATTDSNCVDRYRRDLGHDQVTTMMFAAQPLLHNPVGRVAGTVPTACFAGSWRGEKYPRRVDELTLLLDATMAAGTLVIHDRQPEAALSGDTFPDRFGGAIAGRLDYPEMLRAYRHHEVMLNTNSVVESPTMLSRRVFEALACGTPVVSTPSRAIDEHFAGIVATPSTPADAEEVLGRLLGDDTHRRRVAHLGYRLVHSRHTYEHRLNELFGFMGHRDWVTPEPTVSVVVVARPGVDLGPLARALQDQVVAPAQVVVVAEAGPRSDAERVLAGTWRLVGVDRPGAAGDGDALELGRREADGDYVALVDPGCLYGPHYLADQLLAARFSRAGVVGKAAFHSLDGNGSLVLSGGGEFTADPGVHPATVVLSRQRTSGVALAGAGFAESVGAAVTRLAATPDGVLSADRYSFLDPGPLGVPGGWDSLPGGVGETVNPG